MLIFFGLMVAILLPRCHSEKRNIKNFIIHLLHHESETNDYPAEAEHYQKQFKVEIEDYHKLIDYNLVQEKRQHLAQDDRSGIWYNKKKRKRGKKEKSRKKKKCRKKKCRKEKRPGKNKSGKNLYCFFHKIEIQLPLLVSLIYYCILVFHF